MLVERGGRDRWSAFYCSIVNPNNEGKILRIDIKNLYRLTVRPVFFFQTEEVAPAGKGRNGKLSQGSCIHLLLLEKHQTPFILDLSVQDFLWWE